VTALVVTGSAAAWRQEGGDRGHANAGGTGATLPYSTLWGPKRVSLGPDDRLLEHGVSTGGGRLYATALDGTTVALGLGTGQTLWQRTLVERGVFATAPAYDRERIYVNSRRPGGLWALDAASGRTLWRRSLGNSEGGPLTVKSAVYVAHADFQGWAGFVNKFTRYGTRRWVVPLRCPVTQSPVWTGTYVVIADRCGYVYAFTPSGRRAWQRRVPAHSGAHGAVNYVRGRLYVNTRNDYVFALRPSSGRILWARRTGRGTSYGACAANYWTLWCGNGWRDHRVTAWARSGRRRWTRLIPGSQVMGDLVITGSTLWVCSYSERVTYALSRRTGRTKDRSADCAYTPAAGLGRVTYLVHRLRIEAVA
jgi:outer membrane protein assembly factor BamB